MRVYLHSENAEKSARYPVIVAPAGDEEFVSSEDGAKFRDAKGEPIQYQIDFAFGAAEVEFGLGAYMVARGVAHKSRLTRVVQQFADMPSIEGPTGKFMLQQMAAVAELEAGLISSRTKAALAAARARGQKLGGDRGNQLTDKARQAGCKALTARADARAADLAPIIAELRAAGVTTLRGIAAALNTRGIQTPLGKGEWMGGTVRQLLARLAG